MLIRIEAYTIGEEEIRPGFSRNSGLDPRNGLGYGPELQSSDAGGRQQRREHHMVPRRHADDVVLLGVQSFHKPAPGPARTQDHHPRLVAGHRGAQTRIKGRRLSRLRAEAGEQSVGKRVGNSGSGR